MLLLDLYVFQAVKALASEASEKAKLVIYSLYWGISIAAIILVLLLPFIHTEHWARGVRNYVFATIVGLFIAKLFASVFFFLDDIRRGLTWIILKLLPRNIDESHAGSDWDLSRSAFLSWLGVGIGGAFIGLFTYGFSNKYNYQLRTVKLKFDNLPEGFRGLKILQVSDIHSGSFDNKRAVQHGVDMILRQNADLILFTGDIVNDRAIEMDEYKDVFRQLKAPLGVYSILGNHDYGDYVAWDTIEEKQRNLEAVKDVHRQMGWRLLMNEHVALQRNGSEIALLGIENWSARKNFSRYGRMDLAYAGTEKYPFKILMSHDPTHWDAQVRPKYGDVDLMLAGHTHGMQFGVETPFMKWSPVQWVYKQWAGLYEEGRQKLYINRGYGFIGYPGRVGILPEITVIELV